MADEQTNEEQQQDQQQEGAGRDDEQLGQPGLNALRAERDARKTAERKLAAMRDRLKEFEDRDKTELQKAYERAEAAEKAAAETQTRTEPCSPGKRLSRPHSRLEQSTPKPSTSSRKTKASTTTTASQPVGTTPTRSATASPGAARSGSPRSTATCERPTPTRKAGASSSPHTNEKNAPSLVEGASCCVSWR